MEKTFLSIIVRLSQVDYFGAIEIVIFSKLLLKFSQTTMALCECIRAKLSKFTMTLSVFAWKNIIKFQVTYS